jgi:hypothetical protein
LLERVLYRNEIKEKDVGMLGGNITHRNVFPLGKRLRAIE